MQHILLEVEKMKTADITPDVSLLKKMASVAGSIPSRLMELIDNSIDAKIPGKLLEISVTISKSKHPYIIVEDNGHGMDETTSQSFFRLGDSNKAGKKKIGQFGIGSKIAILGLGDRCSVLTTAIGEPYAIDFHFDVNKFINWNIDYYTKDESPEVHGTRIRIDDLTIRIGDVDRFAKRISEQMSKTYKHFLSSGDVIIKINEQCIYPYEVMLLDGYYQEFDFLIQGKRVHGWAGAANQPGVNWKFGFDLVSNYRIVKSNDMLTRHAHTSLSRLVGEIHLDDFAVDIHKTDFIRHNLYFEKMQDRLFDKELSGLLTKISRLTNIEVHSEYDGNMEILSKSLMKIVGSYDFLRNLDIDEGVLEHLKTRSRKDRIKRQLKRSDELSLEELDELVDRLKIPKGNKESSGGRSSKSSPKIGLLIDEPSALSMGVDHPAKQWNAVEKEDGLHLSIEINLDHPMFNNTSEIGTHLKSAMTESVAEFIFREEKKQSSIIEDDVERLNLIKDLLFRHQNA